MADRRDPGGGEEWAMKVKICGLTRREDAAAAVAAGADYLGAVLSPGFGRSVRPAVAAGFPEGAPPLVAVLVDPSPDEAGRWAREAGATLLQLHGDESPELLRELRERGPWRVWKALRVQEASDVLRGAERFGEVAHGLLLEGAGEGTRGGGHGLRFPWQEVAEIRDRLRPGLRLIVAGGLTPENVGEAVRALRPDIVDVSSGVEASRGIKDPRKVRAFVREARNAAALQGSSPGTPDLPPTRQDEA